MNEKFNSCKIILFAAVSILALSIVSCNIGEKGFREETISAENKAEILNKAQTELTVEEARLLNQYLERSYPNLGGNDLPMGRTLSQMISEERALESTRTESEPADSAPADSNAEPAETAESVAASPPPSRQAPPAAGQSGNRNPPAEAASAPRKAAQQSGPVSQAAPEPATQAPASTSLAGNSGQVEPAAAIPEETVPELPQPTVVEVEPGTDIMVRLVETLGTETAQRGDRFELELAEDLTAGDKLIAPKGTRARGRVIEAQGAGKVKGLATMSITLTDLFIDGEQFPLKAETLTYQAEKTTGKDAAKVGVASGVGALIGAIVGGGKGAAIGAGIGAGAGTGTVLATKGDELEFPVEQMFRFRLTDGFKVEIYEE